ncbi:MAG: hypothetical protein PHH57_08770, partial [Candidatus Omnitrophica bacterium]|nr:hypothetical protein [Candidatus Omnitrophota bacterium]
MPKLNLERYFLTAPGLAKPRKTISFNFILPASTPHLAKLPGTFFILSRAGAFNQGVNKGKNAVKLAYKLSSELLFSCKYPARPERSLPNLDSCFLRDETKELQTVTKPTSLLTLGRSCSDSISLFSAFSLNNLAFSSRSEAFLKMSAASLFPWNSRRFIIMFIQES